MWHGAQKWLEIKFKTIIHSQLCTLVPLTLSQSVCIVLRVRVTSDRGKRGRQCNRCHFLVFDNIHLPRQRTVQRIPIKAPCVCTKRVVRSVYTVAEVVNRLILAHAHVGDDRAQQSNIVHRCLNTDHATLVVVRDLIIPIVFIPPSIPTVICVSVEYDRVATRLVHRHVSNKLRTGGYADRDARPDTVHRINTPSGDRTRNVHAIVHRRGETKLAIRKQVRTISLIKALTRCLHCERRPGDTASKVVVGKIDDRRSKP